MTKLINGYKIIEGVFEAGSAASPSARGINSLGTTGFYFPTATSVGVAISGKSAFTAESDATYGHLFKFKDTTATPNEFQVGNYAASAAFPRTYFLGGQDNTDTNWGIRYAHKDSAAATEIPVLIQLSTNKDTSYTNADTLQFYSGTTYSAVSTVTGSSSNGLPLYLGTHATLTSSAIKIDMVTNGQAITFTPTATTSGVLAGLTYTDPANTGITSATERIAVNYNLSSTKTWADAALVATQRAFVIQAPTYVTGTFTTAATFAVSGAPSGTITNPYAIWSQAGTNKFVGSVLIGTINTPTTPGTNVYPLEIEGSSSTNGVRVRVKNTNSGGAAYYQVENSAGVGVFFGSFGSTVSIPTLQSNQGIGSDNNFYIYSDASLASGGTHSINFATGGYNNVATPRLSIDSAGKITHANTTLIGSQTGFSSQMTGSGSAAGVISAGKFSLLAGYTGASGSFGVYAQNQSAGTAVDEFSNVQAANYGEYIATTAGTVVGQAGYASGGNKSYGGFFRAIIDKAAATNIGVGGFATISTGTAAVGGFFGLMNTAPTYTSAALIADNGATTSPIFLARDNGTTVFSINDVGVITSTYAATSYVSGSGFFKINRTGAITGVAGETATDLSIIPNFTFTEPGSSFAKYYAVTIDMSNVAVTAGAGGSLIGGLHVKAGADADASDNLAILNEGKFEIQDGHFKITQGSAPTTTLTSTTLNDGAGSGASITMGTNATDTAGSFTVTAGNGTPTAGIAGQIVFNIAYGAAPKTVVITPRDTNGVGVRAYVSARGTTSFEISFATASGTSNAQVFDYIVVE